MADLSPAGGMAGFSSSPGLGDSPAGGDSAGVADAPGPAGMGSDSSLGDSPGGTQAGGDSVDFAGMSDALSSAEIDDVGLEEDEETSLANGEPLSNDSESAEMIIMDYFLPGNDDDDEEDSKKKSKHKSKKNDSTEDEASESSLDADPGMAMDSGAGGGSMDMASQGPLDQYSSDLGSQNAALGGGGGMDAGQVVEFVEANPEVLAL
ncbi:hypothetical protein ACNVED_14310 [Legionella sp. D16C41]|uniref:hypothetical protein n=1 Tax=Legionella sp. D16C41 TaxID=3402688 RepID=UPI003AF68035